MASISPHGRGSGLRALLLIAALLAGASVLMATYAPPVQAKTKCTKKGTKGPDILKGTKHKDVLCGRGGADILIGKKGGDTLIGGGGNDVLLGQKGNDDLRGGGGSDQFTGGLGNDKIAGGGGAHDGAAFSDAKGPVVIDLTKQSANGIGKDKLSSIEDVIGSAGNDTITGSSSANKITAGAGDDTIMASAGNDTIAGESGLDSLSYAAANSAVQGGLDSGAISGESTGTDSLSGIEVLTGSPYDDNLSGTDESDTISGGAGDDTLSGGLGDDVLNGDDGNDKIFGGADNDSLHGGPDDDLVDGGNGVNACDGGSGNNTFAGNCDSGPPALSDLRISPATIDTSAASRTVSFQLDLSDDLTGVDAGNSAVIIHSPSGATRSVALTQLSGTGAEGTFAADIVVPRFAAKGTWTVDALLADKGGNSVTITSSELATADHPSSFEQQGEGDSGAPEVAGLAMSPASVDTSQSAQTLHFTVGATDDLAGVDASKSYVDVIGPSGVEKGYTYLSRSSGTDTNGTFSGDVVLPRYSEQGTYTLELLLVDQAGNEILIHSSQLIVGGYTNSFKQTGSGDTAPPQLAAFSRSPAVTDTRSGSASLNVTFTATDGLSGIDIANSKVIIRDPNGVIDSSAAIAANGNNTYTASASLQQGSDPGIWTIDVVLWDKAQNVAEYSSAALTQLGFQSTFQNLGIQGT